MTPEQERTIAHARYLLMTVADSYVLGYRVSDDNNMDELRFDRHGPITDNIGLASILMDRCMESADEGRVE